MHNKTLENLVKMVNLPYLELSIKVPVVETESYYRKITLIDKTNKTYEFILSRWEYQAYKEST